MAVSSFICYEKRTKTRKIGSENLTTTVRPVRSTECGYSEPKLRSPVPEESGDLKLAPVLGQDRMSVALTQQERREQEYPGDRRNGRTATKKAPRRGCLAKQHAMPDRAHDTEKSTTKSGTVYDPGRKKYRSGCLLRLFRKSDLNGPSLA